MMLVKAILLLLLLSPAYAGFFGSTTTWAGDDNNNLNTYVSCWFLMPETGTLTSANLYVVSGTGNVSFAVYTSSWAGAYRHPALYVTNSSKTFAITGTGWRSAAITGGATLAGGTTYWITCNFDADIYIKRATGGSAYNYPQYWISGAYASFPDLDLTNNTDGGGTDGPTSYYYEYSTGGGGTTTTTTGLVPQIMGWYQ